MNYLTNLVQHGDGVAEASNEKPHIFEFDTLCMVVADEWNLDDNLFRLMKK